MSLRRLLGAAVVFLAFQCAAFSQGNSPSQPPMPIVQPLQSIPVPYDAMEPVSGDAQLVQTGEDRAQVIEMFAKGRRLSNVRQFPYLLKTTFTTYGPQASNGTWSIEDTYPGTGIYRWSAQGPSFSGIFLQRDGLLSSNQSISNIPLRVAQLRDAMWSEYPRFSPHTAFLTATGSMSGAEVRCVLMVRGVIRRDEMFSVRRSFDEEEFCFYPQSGLLASYSPVPGYFVRYDYSAALHFHDTIIVPNAFTIYENGRPIVEARTENVGDPASVNDAIFEPTGLQPIGSGLVIDPPVTAGMLMPNLLGGDAPQSGVVIVAAMVSPQGGVKEREIVLSTDESLDEMVLDHLASSGIVNFRTLVQQQAGTTPYAQEVIFTAQVMPRPARPASVRCPPDVTGCSTTIPVN